MSRDSGNQTAKSPWITGSSVLLAVLSFCHLVALPGAAAAQDQDVPPETAGTVEEPPQESRPANNWINASTPAVDALAKPDSFLQYQPPSGICCPGNKSGHLICRLFAWATYFPKYRVCSCCQWCNSCQYKGVKHLHLFFQNPKCVEGSGLHATFGHECYRNCNHCDSCGHP